MIINTTDTPNTRTHGTPSPVHWVPLKQVVDFVNDTIAHVPYYQNIRAGVPITELEQMPFLTGEILNRYALPESRDLLRFDAGAGYIFSSVDVSGRTKFSVYTFEELAESSRLLALGYLDRGLKKGDIAANLFMTGNMWGTFSVVEKALANLEVFQLPICGQNDPLQILDYLIKFKPKAIFAVPALLMQLERLADQHHVTPEIPYVFYAGGTVNETDRHRLCSRWHIKGLHSAGYFSPDAGVMGYQCAHCNDGEHHLYADNIHMEIIDGEAVVTSLLRKTMPFIRYRTGDHVRLLPETPGACPCGSTNPKFLLIKHDAFTQSNETI